MFFFLIVFFLVTFRQARAIQVRRKSELIGIRSCNKVVSTNACILKMLLKIATYFEVYRFFYASVVSFENFFIIWIVIQFWHSRNRSRDGSCLAPSRNSSNVSRESEFLSIFLKISEALSSGVIGSA